MDPPPFPFFGHRSPRKDTTVADSPASLFDEGPAADFDWPVPAEVLDTYMVVPLDPADAALIPGPSDERPTRPRDAAAERLKRLKRLSG